MTCRELTDFLADYLAGRLPEAVAREFEDHLADCRDCGTYLQNYRETIRLTRETSDEIPADVPDELVDAVIAACRRLC